MPTEGTDSLSYESRDSKRHGRGHSYSGGYGSSDLGASDSYGSYGGPQVFLITLPLYRYLMQIKGKNINLFDPVLHLFSEKCF